jgi:hypothetical protein
MIRDPNIFRSGNAPIHKHGHDVAPEAPSTLNVRYGSKADISRHSHLCPLSGVKRTFSVEKRTSQSLCPLSGAKRTFGETPQLVHLAAAGGHQPDVGG